MPEKETIRIAKLNPTNDCPYLIDTKPVLDNPMKTKSNCAASDLPFTSPIKTHKETHKNRLLALT